MGRKRRKVSGFYPIILQKTSFEKNENNNFLLKTVDKNEKPINYIVPQHLLQLYIEKMIEYVIIAGEITHEEATELLFKDIFTAYKTKISTTRISLLILNMMVKEGLLFSDDNEEYKLIKSPEELKEWFYSFFL